MEKNFNDEENSLNQELFGMVNSHSSTSPYIEANYGKTPTKPQDYRINAKPGRNTSNDKPYYPHTPSVPPKAKYPKKIYKSSNKLSSKKKNKLPRALSLLLATGFLVGGIKAITLGIDYIRDNTLAESQEHLSNLADSQNIYERTGLTEQENNTVEILNSDLNSFIQKYEENPGSVTKDELNTLLQNCYSIGKDVAFDKIARALILYYHQNPNDVNSQVSSQYYFSYRLGNPKNNEPLYYIAQCKLKNSTPVAYIPIATNKEIQDYVASQYALLDYINHDNINFDDAIKKAKEATTQINNMVNYKLHYEKGLLNKNLVIDTDKDIDR